VQGDIPQVGRDLAEEQLERAPGRYDDPARGR